MGVGFNIATQLVDWISTPYTIYLVLKDPDVPWQAKMRAILLLVLMFGYVLNPVDTVPDYIPVLGWLDDLVVVPLGMYLIKKVVPEIDVAAKRDKARKETKHLLWQVALSVLAGVIVFIVMFGGVIYLIVSCAGLAYFYLFTYIVLQCSITVSFPLLSG